MSALLLLMTLAAGDGPAVDFDNEVIPVLTRAGCNSGACHGAAIGRGGFRLSLYGGDPAADYESIVLELEGRRVNLARPEDSLLFLKPTESMQHGGGLRLDYDGASAKLLLRWIEQGTPRVRQRQLMEFQVSPHSQVLSKSGEGVQLRATAKFSDGTTRDVTAWTVFTPDDAEAVSIDPQTAFATVQQRGRQIIVARYLDRVVPVELLVPLSDVPLDLSREPRVNFIDEQVLQRLELLRLPVSPQADDVTFLRRVTLDLTGRLPTLEQQQKYRSDTSPRRRETLVDELLASPAFNEFWTWQLGNLLRLGSQGDAESTRTYHAWLKQQIAERKPYDLLARELLLATGDTRQVGPASFHRTTGGAREEAEMVSELFLGARLRCANCHNHPLDQWTQDDYHGLAAIFSRLERGQVIRLLIRGEVIHPRTGEAAIPRIPGDSFLKPDSDGRETLAIWLTSKENPYFARAIVNRLWKSLMGRGLVEPTDDLRATNPATHPELLDQLAADFVDHGYDLRQTLRLIALSAPYARSADALPDNTADDRFYSRAMRRPLPGAVLADAIGDVTGVPERFLLQPPDTRAVMLRDGNAPSETLDILGRCSRGESCEPGDTAAGGLTRMLHLLNGPLLNRRVTDPQGRLAKRIAAGIAPLEIIIGFYRLAFSRELTEREQTFWQQQLAEVPPEQQRQFLEDFLWSLLSSQEFITNH